MSAPLPPVDKARMTSTVAHGAGTVTTDTMSASVTFLRERLTRAPTVLLILGSGLGALADELKDAVRIPYSEIPGFPRSTVAGHEGVLVEGIWEGVEVVAMKGRSHLYEGLPREGIALPLRVFRSLGVTDLIVTNSAGGIRADLRPGDLMLIADHLNLMFRSTLSGPAAMGEERFPDMSAPYDELLQEMAIEAALGLGIPLTRGIFAGMLGPAYETPAEIEMLRRFGADAVGMSTVPEVLAALALGMRVLGIACIANAAASSGGPKLSHDEVLAAGAGSAHHVGALLRDFIPRAMRPNLPTE